MPDVGQQDKPPFTLVEVREMILGEPLATIAEFRSRFKKDLEQFLKSWHRLYALLTSRAVEWQPGERRTAVATFLHSAAYSLNASAFVLVRGLPSPFGNLMRQYGEATAMALLCADPATGVLELYVADKKNYPYRKALQRVEESRTSAKLAKSLGLDAAAWASFKRITKFYDQHSHLSVITMGFAQRLSKENPGAVIGPDFDPAKFKIYRDEFRRLRSACDSLEMLIRAIDKPMSKLSKS
jgi:hypothetical protein